MPFFRTLLVLGRVANLPTVWSNCLAGWWLAGGGNIPGLVLVMLGASLLYLGGMFLNDAFDARFDAQHRRERPIPSGKITETMVWRFGYGFLATGLLVLFISGMVAGFIGVLLAGTILLFNLMHKVFTVSPVLLGACRALLYPLAASVSPDGVNGMAVWCGMAMGFYASGVAFLGTGVNRRDNTAWWPCSLLVAPVLLALFMNRGDYFENALLLGVASLLWSMRCLRGAFVIEGRNLGRSVSGLMVGIVLVDLLAALDVTRPMALVFLALMGLNELFQRLAPVI
jgi:4-hydroxybenzoate polyprenyltransferase